MKWWASTTTNNNKKPFSFIYNIDFPTPKPDFDQKLGSSIAHRTHKQKKTKKK